MMSSISPTSPAATAEQMQRVVDTIIKHTTSSSKVLLLTGAGLSTAAPSNLKDYRSKNTGLYEKGYRPLTYQKFISTTFQQQRYFARSYFGYLEMLSARPNAAHFAIAKMIRDTQWASHVVTQNVDGLHHNAMLERPTTIEEPNPPCFPKGDERARDWITQLHGCIHSVVCMSCGQKEHREELQERMTDMNRIWLRRVLELEEQYQNSNSKLRHEDEFMQKQQQQNQLPTARPDGDYGLTEDLINGFTLPKCTSCSGPLRPDVVLFGDSIPRDVRLRAEAFADSCSVLVCAGTSLQVPSAYRFVRQVCGMGRPVIVLNSGPTRLDEEEQTKKPGVDMRLVQRVEGRVEDLLSQLATSLPQ